jgi:Coenzyme PQQ synthesis protein D (PqqD)
MLPHPHPSVVFQKLDDGAVLFAPATELYFGLNAVGALIWEMLPPQTSTAEELHAAIGSRFPDVAAETIRADVDELLASLLAEGLLVLPGTAAGATTGGDAAPTP